MVSTLLALQTSSRNPSVYFEFVNSDQIVPECSDFEVRDEDAVSQDCSVSIHEDVETDFPSLFEALHMKILFQKCDHEATSPTVPNLVFESCNVRTTEARRNDRSKAKIPKLTDDHSLDQEKDSFSKCCHAESDSLPGRDPLSKSNKIKFAMLRLGATSVNKITALSFNYANKS